MEEYIVRCLREAPECPSAYGREHLFASEFLDTFEFYLEPIFHGPENLAYFERFRNHLVTHIRSVRDRDPGARSPSRVRRYFEDRIGDVHRMISGITNGVLTQTTGVDDHRSSPVWDVPRHPTGFPDLGGTREKIQRLRQRHPASAPIEDVTEPRGRALLTDVFGADGVWNDQDFPGEEEIGNFIAREAEHQQNQILCIYAVPKGRATARVRRLIGRYRELLWYGATSGDSDDGERARRSIDQIFDLFRSFPCGNPQYFTEPEFPRCREMLSHLWSCVTVLRLTKCALPGLEGRLYVPATLRETTRGSTQHWVRLPDFEMDGGPNVRTHRMMRNYDMDGFFRWTCGGGDVYGITLGNELVPLRRRERWDDSDDETMER